MRSTRDTSRRPDWLVPRELLDRPVPLRQGIGKVHEAVTTSSPEAQGSMIKD